MGPIGRTDRTKIAQLRQKKKAKIEACSTFDMVLIQHSAPVHSRRTIHISIRSEHLCNRHKIMLVLNNSWEMYKLQFTITPSLSNESLPYKKPCDWGYRLTFIVGQFRWYRCVQGVKTSLNMLESIQLTPLCPQERVF